MDGKDQMTFDSRGRPSLRVPFHVRVCPFVYIEPATLALIFTGQERVRHREWGENPLPPNTGHESLSLSTVSRTTPPTLLMNIQ